MLTRQAWLTLLASALLAVAGRLLGLVELVILAAIAAALVAVAALMVLRVRLDLEVGRAVHPARHSVGTHSRVELTARNLASSTTPVLHLHDPVSGTRGADLLVAPLGRRERTVAAYRLPTTRRGLVEIGPLSVVVSDPFGLARRATVASPAVEVTVHPRVDDIDPLPYTTGHDPLSGARQPNSLGRTGEDFYALRPYVVGDDLRRIHWPSSARHDELLVRQQELPWQGRTTVLVDVRRSTNTAESLDVAVSVAASVITASAKRHDLVRLITTAGTDSDFAPGSDHVEAIMEHLAVVPLASAGSLRRVIDLLTRRPSGGAMVAVVANVPADDLLALSTLRARFGSLSVVHLDASLWDESAPAGPAPAVPTLHITRDAPFVPAWNLHVRTLAQRRTRTPTASSLS